MLKSEKIENAKQEYIAFLQARTKRALFKYRERYLLEVKWEGIPFLLYDKIKQLFPQGTFQPRQISYQKIQIKKKSYLA